jgi:uncharacterized protein (DUF433 family)
MKIVLERSDLADLPVNLDPEILGGTPVFSGTRVPIEALWGNMAEGASLDEFLDWFPTVGREQAEAVLRFGYRTLAVAA